MERCAIAHFPFGPDPSAQTQHDASHGDQSDTGALEFVAVVQALENAEQFLQTVRMHPYDQYSNTLMMALPIPSKAAPEISPAQTDSAPSTQNACPGLSAA
jgi:hypothetical protein